MEAWELVQGLSPAPLGVMPPGAVETAVEVGQAAVEAGEAVACEATGWAAVGLGEAEQLVRLLETALVQLQQVVGEIQQVGNQTRDSAEAIRPLTGIEWHSAAGRAFAETTEQIEVRVRALAQDADEAAVLGRLAAEDLQQRIGGLRGALAAARATVAGALTGVC